MNKFKIQILGLFDVSAGIVRDGDDFHPLKEKSTFNQKSINRENWQVRLRHLNSNLINLHLLALRRYWNFETMSYRGLRVWKPF